MPQENDYKNQLNQERNQQQDAPIQPSNFPSTNPRKIAGQVLETFSFFKFVQINDIFFALAIIFAILKDILDIFVIGSLPVIGTILTLMASFVVFCAMLICGAGAKRAKIKSTARKWMALLGGTFFELFFGLNFFPMETFVTVLSFVFILKERSEAHRQEQEEIMQQQEAIEQEEYLQYQSYLEEQERQEAEDEQS